MKQFGIQLYTIRDHMDSEEAFSASLNKLSDLGYSYLHTAGCPIDEKRFIEIIKEHGMSVCGTHYSYEKVISDVSKTTELHRLWETSNIGIGGMPGYARESLNGLKDFICKFNDAAKIYAKDGFRLTYHNHDFEFARIDGNKTMMDILYEELDPDNVSFVLDTCWVQVGGGDVRHWIEKLKGRLDILHLKDCRKRDDGSSLVMTEVGNGNLWMDGIIYTARACNVEYYVVEQDGHWLDGDPFESAKASADFLKKLI